MDSHYEENFTYKNHDYIDDDGSHENDNYHDDLINDALFNSANSDTDIAIKIGKYTCEANLDKQRTEKLLKLLELIHNHENSPPTSMTKLLEKLDIKFEYVTVRYCTNCMIELDECTCGSRNKYVPSELITFPIAKEISRVVTNNYNLIKKYKLEKDFHQDDIIMGMLIVHGSTK